MTKVKLTVEEIKARMKEVPHRLRGESYHFREGYMSALHDVAEDGGFDNCKHIDIDGWLEKWYDSMGDDKPTD